MNPSCLGFPDKITNPYMICMCLFYVEVSYGFIFCVGFSKRCGLMIKACFVTVLCSVMQYNVAQVTNISCSIRESEVNLYG